MCKKMTMPFNCRNKLSNLKLNLIKSASKPAFELIRIYKSVDNKNLLNDSALHEPLHNTPLNTLKGALVLAINRGNGSVHKA
jgi:hypothetical protein